MSAIRIISAVCLLSVAQPAHAEFPGSVEGWTIARTAGRECVATGRNIEITAAPFENVRFKLGIEARDPDQVLAGSRQVAYSIGVGSSEYAGFTLKPAPFGGISHWAGFTSGVTLILDGSVEGTAVLEELRAKPTLMAAPTGQSQATVARPTPPAVMDAVNQCLADVTRPNEPVQRTSTKGLISIFDQLNQVPAGAVLAASSYTLGISERGYVTSCIVQRSTGYAVADSLVCAELKDNAIRFRPATDAQGKAKADTFLLEVPAVTMP